MSSQLEQVRKVMIQKATPEIMSRYSWTTLIVGAALLFGCPKISGCHSLSSPPPGTPQNPNRSPVQGPNPVASGTVTPIGDGGQPADVAARLHPDDLAYVGAFRLPEEFAWGARGMTYYPQGRGGNGTLLITGFELPRNRAGQECTNGADCFAYYGEVEIPTPARVSNHGAAPQARLVGSMRRFDNALVGQPDHTLAWVSDIALLPQAGGQGRPVIYGARTMWYAEGLFGEETFPTIWLANLDGSGVRGLFHVGANRSPFHGRKMGDYLFVVPQWYADQYLGGRILVTGRSRGTPVGRSRVAGGSQGPTFFAFNPAGNSDRAGSRLDALPILYYRTFHPECAGDNVGSPENCDYPHYTMCDIWTGADFVELGNKKAIVLVGHKGLGRNCYDHPPIDCEDPCSDDHGYHCNPYERQVIFYDVSQLGRSAQGEGDPWKVLPYLIWRPAEFFLDGHTCFDAGGLAFDRQGRRLFMVERGLGGADANQTVVHVWTAAQQ